MDIASIINLGRENGKHSEAGDNPRPRNRGKTMMRRRALLVVAAVILSTTAMAQTSRYDGRWAVVLVCPQSPDGALPFTWQFLAEVRGGMLHGQYGTAGRPASMSLDGAILSDGSARLQAHGLTGQPAYNIAQTTRGVPFEHDVIARFDASRGTGTWVTPRTCTFSFTR